MVYQSVLLTIADAGEEATQAASMNVIGFTASAIALGYVGQTELWSCAMVGAKRIEASFNDR